MSPLRSCTECALQCAEGASQPDLLTAKMAKMAPMRSPSRLLVAAASVEQSRTSGALSAMVLCFLQAYRSDVSFARTTALMLPYPGC